MLFGWRRAIARQQMEEAGFETTRENLDSARCHWVREHSWRRSQKRNAAKIRRRQRLAEGQRRREQMRPDPAPPCRADDIQAAMRDWYLTDQGEWAPLFPQLKGGNRADTRS